MTSPGTRQHYRFYVENEKGLRGDINTLGLHGTNVPIYRGTQTLSADQGPVGSGQTASLVPSRGRVGSPGLGPSRISGPNFRASSSSQVPARPQNYMFPVAEVPFI